jgi:hypothetical protein
MTTWPGALTATPHTEEVTQLTLVGGKDAEEGPPLEVPAVLLPAMAAAAAGSEDTAAASSDHTNIIHCSPEAVSQL